MVRHQSPSRTTSRDASRHSTSRHHGSTRSHPILASSPSKRGLTPSASISLSIDASISLSTSPSRIGIASPSSPPNASITSLFALRDAGIDLRPETLTSPAWNSSPGQPFLESWALVKAAGLGDSTEVGRLIEVCGQSPNASRKPGLTALGAAVRNGRSDAVQTLLALGADPELSSWEAEGAMTPLTIACKHGSRSCLQLLLNARADASQRCHARALSPLGWAIEGANVQLVQTLVSARAPLVGCTHDGVGPMALAKSLMQRAVAAQKTEDARTHADLGPTTQVIARLVQIFDLLRQAEAEAEAEAHSTAAEGASEMGADIPVAGTVLFFPDKQHPVTRASSQGVRG